MTITIEKEKMEKVLEALELSAVTVDSFGVQKKTQEAITAIKQALAEPVQPAAWESEMRSELAKLGFEGQCPESIGITIKRWLDACAESLTAQPAPVQPVAWVDLLKQAEEVVRSKSLWKKYIDGTPPANDIAVWMASFAQEHTTLPAQPAPVQPETDLCGSGAGCLYKVAMIEHLESEVEHLKAAQPVPVQEPVAIALNTGTKQGVKWLKNVEHGVNLYTAQPASASWMEMVTANLVREGIGKHKARELAEHFYGLKENT